MKGESNMLKKVICLLTALCLTLGVLPALARDAGDLNDYGKAAFTEGYDVYTGPGTSYYRVGGNAHYSRGTCRVYGVVGDWLMVGYGGSNNSYHIGYIPKEALNHIDHSSGTIDQELTFTSVQDTIIDGGCNLTDDPVINNTLVTTLSGGTSVTILGHMGGWAYIETQAGGKTIRGFVRSFHVNSGAKTQPTAKPTAQPTAKPAPTAQPTAKADPTAVPTARPDISGKESLLSSLKHNCPNTGVMLPASFSPYQYSYVLTVASWVSRVSFTPTAYDSRATITVNGTALASGATTGYFQMTNEPQQVTIAVRGVNGAETTYTIFLQRRPSENRTRVSAGYIQSVYQQKDKWYISADLVTVQYWGNDYNHGNRSNFTNEANQLYKYPVNVHCDFYYGTVDNAVRARNVSEFLQHYKDAPDAMYTIVYIEDEIVAVMPYAMDYDGAEFG